MAAPGNPHLVEEITVMVILPFHTWSFKCLFSSIFLVRIFASWRNKYTYASSAEISLLKPAGHVMHQQFNIQQLYALRTLYLCVLYLSENKQRLVPLTASTDWFL